MVTTEPPPLITECPNCHTRFRVGESQLQIAHGRVRCGACLAVFAGVDHLLLDDATPAPELTSETNMLESVLAELAEEDSTKEDGEAGLTGYGATAARAYELDALAAERGDTQELELSGGFLAVELDPDGENLRVQPELESGEDADWTNVEVDTQEFGPRVTLELASSGASSRFDDAPAESAPRATSQPRATIEDALNNEEALRWWLEDELPSEANGFAVDDDDSMVVQLSELDMVHDDDDLALQQLLSTPEAGSKSQLEALFRELREDGESVGQGSTALDSSALQPTSAQATSEQALRDVVSDLKADAEPIGAQTPDFQTTGAEAISTGSSESVASVAAPPAVVASEQSSADLQSAIDQAEPLVTRAVANSALAVTANKVAAAERVAAAEQAASAAGPTAADKSAADKTAAVKSAVTSIEIPPAQYKQAEVTDSGNDLLAAGHGAELIEPPPESPALESTGWDSATFPVTPAESVEGLAAEMSVAGRTEREKVGAGKAALDTAKSTLERWLGNPYALRIGTVLASLLLVGQVMFWQFDDWAKSPTLRPVYASVCSVVGCELPLRRSVQDMQSRKLAVRSHPDKADKLLVDALIINEAEFAQPFPVIELQFMDLSQQVVESYRLEPGEYLDGELAGSDQLMAVRTPVHIDIEIADPGPSAVNYQLQFH